MQAAHLKSHTEEIVDKIFDLADANNDGVLSREEFVRYTTDKNIIAAIKKFSSLEDPSIHKQMAQEIKEKTPVWIVELAKLSQEEIDAFKVPLTAFKKMNQG